jgi:hypothetical protein
MLRFSLRTLIVVMLLGGPVLAGLWFSGAWIVRNSVTSVLFGILIAMFLAAATLAVNLND